MRAHNKLVLGLAALGFVASAGTASATTRCANPTGTAPCLKLQAAVDASAPGDTVTVNAGTYTGTALDPYGYVYVGYGKDGLKINGAGTVVIDMEFKTGNATGDGMDIYSGFVTVSNITFRNGNYGLYSYYNQGTVFSNVKVLGAENDCFYFYYADFVTVKGSKCIASKGSGVYTDYGDYVSVTGSTFSQIDYGLEAYEGNNTTFSSNIVLNPGEYGVYLYGYNGGNYTFGATIKSNTITNVNNGTSASYNQGIYVAYMDGANITSNKVSNTYDHGIYLQYSDNSIVSSNTLTNIYYEGIYLYGSSAQIKNNTINNADGAAIYVDSGYSDADSAQITGNKISNYPGGDGIDYYGDHGLISGNIMNNVNTGIYTDDSSPRIISNTITNYQNYGIDAEASAGVGGVIQLNKLTNGAGDEYGIYVEHRNAYAALQVLSNTVNASNYACFYFDGSLQGGVPTSINAVGNKGYDCGYSASSGYGFELSYPSNTPSGIKLTSNLIQRAAGDGYYIEAPFAELTANTSDSTAEDGFDVHTRGVKLVNNKATNNAGVGFEWNNLDATTAATMDASSMTATGNIGNVGNAAGACISQSMTNAAAFTATATAGNTFGTVSSPAICNEASGYIGN